MVTTRKGKKKAKKSGSDSVASSYRSVGSDDDINLETEDASIKTTKSTKSTKSEQLRQKLGLNVEKALLDYIEEYGGLHSNGPSGFHKFFQFSEERYPLSALCDEHQHLFGEPNSTLRDKIRKRVDTLKKRKPKEKYFEHLNNLNVKPHYQRHNPQPFKRKQVSVASAVPISSQEHSSLPRAKVVEAVREEEQQEQTPKSPPKVINATKPSLVSPLASRRSSNYSTPTTTTTMADDRYDYDNEKMIPIDMEGIGDQGEGLVITPFWGEELGNQLYDGVEISTTADVRDVRAGHYELKFNGPKGSGHHQFIYTKPRWEATYHDQQDKIAYEAKEQNQKVKQGHNSARVAYSELPPSAQRKEFPVVFPTSVALSDIPYGGATDQFKIKYAVIPYATGTGIYIGNPPQEVKGLVTRVCWRLVDMKSARNVAADTVDTEADLLKAFQGASLASMPVPPVAPPMPVPPVAPPAAPAVPDRMMFEFEGVFKPDAEAGLGYAGYFEMEGGPTLKMQAHEIDNERFTQVYIAAYEAYELQTNAGLPLQSIFDTFVQSVVAEQRQWTFEEEQRRRQEEEQRRRQEEEQRRLQELQSRLDNGTEPPSNLEGSRLRREQESVFKAASDDERTSLQRATRHGKKKRAEKLNKLRQANHGVRSRGVDCAQNPTAAAETNAFVFDTSGTEFDMMKSMEASTPKDDASNISSVKGDDAMDFVENLEDTLEKDLAQTYSEISSHANNVSSDELSRSP